MIEIHLPEHSEDRLRDAWGEQLSQAAFEGLLIESYRSARLSAGELGELLGLDSSVGALAWLSERGVCLNYSLDDLQADRRLLAADFPAVKP